MERLMKIEKSLLIAHLLSMVFGLAGILIVLPHPELVARLPESGLKVYSWSMGNGGVMYMLLGTLAVAIYAYRTLGLWHWLGFMLPAIGLSLMSELLGTSTGFPFGHYHYLTGLGYKIQGLVPFTIPLSWFYLGFSGYLIARAGLNTLSIPGWLKIGGSIVFGSILLTSWDFVLDPAMSQTTLPFWLWEQPGAFFGMPYQNFAGWFGTGVVFMSVASIIWGLKPIETANRDLTLPLVVYLGNFGFAAVMSISAGFYIPLILGIFTGVIPALVLYLMAQNSAPKESDVTPINPLIPVAGGTK
jgi:putative membrane protein